MISQLQMVERLFVLVAHRPVPALSRYIPHALVQLAAMLPEMPWAAAHTCWLRARVVCTDPPPAEPREPLRFRISCKSSLCALKAATTEEISQAVGRAVAGATGWTPNPREYDLEVCAMWEVRGRRRLFSL